MNIYPLWFNTVLIIFFEPGEKLFSAIKIKDYWVITIFGYLMFSTNFTQLGLDLEEADKEEKKKNGELTIDDFR